MTQHGSTMESRAFSKLMVTNIAVHCNQWTDKDNEYWVDCLDIAFHLEEINEPKGILFNELTVKIF